MTLSLSLVLDLNQELTQFRTSIIGSPTSSHEMNIPPFSIPNISRNTATMSDSPLSEPPPPSRSASWTAANTTRPSSPRGPAGGGGGAAGDWDHQHASAAQQLVGLSKPPQQQQLGVPESLQHERPVPKKIFPGTAASTVSAPAAAATRYGSAFGGGLGGGRGGIGDALDLDELQNFLSWDIYGIMDLGETISASGYDEDVKRSEWSSMI